jgi:hypothetical protein
MNGAHRSRIAMIVLLLCAVFAQAFAFESEREHHDSSQHCCLLCHLGPLPFVEAAITSAAEPPLAIAWLPSPAQREGKHEVLLRQDPSRAPPVSSVISL